MGFFKNIGKAVKKGVKQISLKNLVKIGTPLLGAIPIVGGLAQNTVQGVSDSHAMKKEAQRLEAEGKIAEAQAMQAQADFLAKQSGSNVGTVASTTLNAFTKGATEQFVSDLPQSVTTAGGVVGVAVIDSTINEWFKKHWKKSAIGLAVLVSVFFIWKNRKKRTTTKKPNYRK